MAREIVYSEDGVINARVKQKVDTLPDWEANDMTILEGEQAFVTAPDGTPVNFKIGDGTKPFRDLPFWLDSGSPFKLRLSDTQYVQILGTDTVVTHPGLIGFDDYPVTTTQLNIACFRDNELIYDGTNGRVTILNFTLQSGELIILSPPSMKWAATTGSGGAIAQLIARVEELERKSAPFTVNENTGDSPARVWWTRPVSEIPPGWVEDTEWRDYTPIHAPNPPQIGDTVGSNTRTLTTNQQGSFQVSATSDRSAGAARNNATYNFRFGWGSGESVLWAGSGANVPVGPITVRLSDASESIDVRQRSKYGIWIKYVGV